ncbi:squalene synthase HpnC [Hyphomicrobium denitrificans 1NES1]|uniref:Squalene synthase HpnC n=1 Tax=Hyphomicrobium denitrificans 1NES1 TaxID=670307 RepID=N0AZR1_9HYPH|nr:squalene synthase HpnC [Hyphomicrobium denitrificans]AGK56659.1 squalene synthase HpnC [Hyphomicrobium denitrificans 1NES1]
MTVDTAYKSGKSEHDENFPVASRIIASRYRAPILAFYRFARAADDAADHESLDPSAKLAILAALEDTLLGRSDTAADALPLRAELQRRGLSSQHALDLLRAFRQDVTKNRYANWAELIDYCRYSAMPVGRFVLDVHGESQSTWAPSDALCTALQIINHVQDCGKDYRNLDRVYIPLDDMARHGADVADLARSRSSPQLLACLRDVVARTGDLLPEASQLPPRVSDLRLGVETSVIVGLARELVNLLGARDPLADPVHLSKARATLITGRAAALTIAARATGKRATYQAVRDDVA